MNKEKNVSRLGRPWLCLRLFFAFFDKFKQEITIDMPMLLDNQTFLQYRHKTSRGITGIFFWEGKVIFPIFSRREMLFSR